MHVRFMSPMKAAVILAAIMFGPAVATAAPSGCIVWKSNLSRADLGKTGANGLLASWGQVKTWSTKNMQRISADFAPDGSLAYEVFFSGNDNRGVRGPFALFDQTGGRNLRHLYGELKVYFPNGYWSSFSGGHKLVRLWAGLDGERAGARYGRAVINDASSSVHVVINRFRTYSYYRNRPSKGGVITDPPRSHWGMPEGRWVTLGQEILVNDPGARNGYLKFFIDGEEVAARHGLDWLRDREAGFQGFGFSGWIGGYRIVDQRYWLKDFKLHDLDGC